MKRGVGGGGGANMKMEVLLTHEIVFTHFTAVVGGVHAYYPNVCQYWDT